MLQVCPMDAAQFQREESQLSLLIELFPLVENVFYLYVIL